MARKLMIVDDSAVIRRLIARSLKSNDVEVVGDAGNGRKAVEVFQATRPELVTMDITMPEMDGLACISELITMSPEVRILVISALADKATGIEALKRGAMAFLCKPFTQEEFDDALAELVEEE